MWPRTLGILCHQLGRVRGEAGLLQRVRKKKHLAADMPGVRNRELELRPRAPKALLRGEVPEDNHRQGKRIAMKP